MGVYTFGSLFGLFSRHVLRIVVFLFFIISYFTFFFEWHQDLSVSRRED